MKRVDNAALELESVPASDSSDDTMLAFSATFFGYEVWGGWEPCALAANDIAATWEASEVLPSSLTLLRTALFFETRRERFVDYGGFGEDPAGVRDHRKYMRRLLNEIRERIKAGERDDEDETIVAWLESHSPAPSVYVDDYEPDPEWPDLGPPTLEDDHVAAAVALAARILALDLQAGTEVSENRLRDRLCLALEHLAPVIVERERAVPVEGFQGVGPVDILLHDYTTGALCGLVECKWSTDLSRDTIYQGAWDAIKLALSRADHADRWLVTGAPEASWQATETPDLFADGTIDTVELWQRALTVRGPNGGMTVGADCEAGGYGNMFTHAQERLRIKLVADAPIPHSDRRLKAARVIGGEGRLIRFAEAPEFPRTIGDRWLHEHVPTMSQDQFERLITRLRTKRWTDDELAQKVFPLR